MGTRAGGKGGDAVTWELRYGVYCCGPYRVMQRGARWIARKIQKQSHPHHLGMYDTAHDGMAACMDDRRNAAGTVDREEGMRLEVRG